VEANSFTQGCGDKYILEKMPSSFPIREGNSISRNLYEKGKEENRENVKEKKEIGKKEGK
jgi:hypothetical protein